ncbi:hypothetical protein LMH87_005005 [Akanthomyces muscarius]|uniref:Uncharacterized protein n=1 Tax=Akanthomyces muscarius TaxID=2231603 RepID=A0A9W8QMV7_AKAMU|nr:hypothetical protein LMH87_005005 [Akanthomyces muscarius]KAJ4163264.1 hypothetical protein LMH87_005005 [Akanthomyces muscarius]
MTTTSREETRRRHWLMRQKQNIVAPSPPMRKSQNTPAPSPSAPPEPQPRLPDVITIQRLSFLQRFLGLFSHLKNTVVCAHLGETRNLALRAKVGDGELGLGVYEGLLVSLGLLPLAQFPFSALGNQPLEKPLPLGFVRLQGSRI